MTIPAASSTSAAYRDALLALQKQQRAQLTTLIQQTEAALHEDWLRGPGIVSQYYAPLIDQYARALNDLRALNDDPAAKLSLDWLTSQNQSLRQIEANVRYTLDKYATEGVDAVTAAQRAAANAGLTDASALTQEALSPAWEKGVNPAMLFSRPNPDAIAAWVGRAGNGHPLGDLFSNFSSEATSAARQAMLLGLATGANPLQMVSGIQQAMGISRSRAITIARTEVLGSYRAAAHMTYRQNSDVLNYWLWSAGGANPCAMCMGMDGTLHGLEESLDDHPCGKCAPLPVTKPWSDILGPLGIDASDLEETSIGAPGAYETGEEKFARMSPEKQREIIGTKTGYEAYQRGEVSLKDFIGVRPAEDGFPSSYYQRSLRELQIPTRQGHLVEPSQLIAGPHRAIQRGVMTPDELMPAWAKQSAASRNVYQILRNGLPYDMMSHEQGLLITNLEQMLREDIPVNVRAAVERQLQALGQSVERQTAGTAAREVAEDVATREAATATFSVDPLTADELHAQMARVADLIQPPEVFQAAQFDLGYDAKVQARVGQEIADRLAGNADFARLADKFMELAQPEIDDLRARGWADEAIQRWIADNVPQTLQQIAAELTEAWGRGRNTIYPALKDAVRSEFNLSGVARRSARAANREAAAIWADYQPGLRAFVRAMYENTQDWLRANNITEVPLYRGIAWTRLPAQLDAAQMDMEAHTIEIAMNAASSFTASAEDALNYATDATFSDVDARYGQVIAARVPAELILSTPQSGFGNIGEFEFVVLGGRYKVVSIGQDLTALERYLRLADVERLLETT